MTTFIHSVGSLTLSSVRFWSALVDVFVSTLKALVFQILRFRFRGRETLLQVYEAAVLSFPVVVFSLSFVGLMLIIEFSFHMKLVLRQDSLVPAFSTVLMLRELGPVVTSLLLTSRVAAGFAAEIGSMKVTEQIDAMQLMGVDPIEYLGVPRVIAAIFSCVALSVVAVATSVFMGAMFSSTGRSPEEFFSTMFTFIGRHDAIACVVKSAVFGLIFSIVAVNNGLRCGQGSDGVGVAATNSVVHSSVLIIIADFLLTYFLYAV